MAAGIGLFVAATAGLTAAFVIDLRADHLSAYLLHLLVGVWLSGLGDFLYGLVGWLGELKREPL